MISRLFQANNFSVAILAASCCCCFKPGPRAGLNHLPCRPLINQTSGLLFSFSIFSYFSFYVLVTWRVLFLLLFIIVTVIKFFARLTWRVEGEGGERDQLMTPHAMPLATSHLSRSHTLSPSHPLSLCVSAACAYFTRFSLPYQLTFFISFVDLAIWQKKCNKR